ncbi:MAG: CpsD/CapB family tyrosine-protein kinase [Candidatus Omnitrophica bacterium]|nr:CpsD/CapB family tyrosine-protein kinase [Candidatus Omnitrophota bacterium]MCF7878877.1 CpsD/CapB family tyrosine-protein kinase [Candidatus Omnitrophota bacterium]MCF7893716.1 CpsD/CapB family tyrosine-protein kinase [Candidatus Omnitrophota bacterium]
MLRKGLYFFLLIAVIIIFFVVYQILPPSFDNILYSLSGIFIIGMFLTYFLKRRSRIVVNAQDIKSHLNLPFLGYIPYVKGKDKCQTIFELRNKKKELKSSFVKFKETLSVFSPENKPFKVLGVTSASSREGKSFYSVNLAASYAEDKKDTLLINANLRQEFLSFFSKTKTHKGLSDVLSGQSSFQEAIVSIDLDHLFFMPRGALSPEPQQLLKSENFNNLIKEAKKKFEKIIINLPPVLTCSDISFIEDKCEGIILVVLGKESKLSLLLKSKKILNKNTKIIGAALNKNIPAKSS